MRASTGHPRGFRSDSPTGSDRAQGSPNFSSIRASRIRFGPPDRVGPERGATSGFRRSWVEAKRFHVATEICSITVFLCHDRVGQGKEKLCRDIAILCRDRVGQGRENFYLDQGFLGRNRVGHDRKFCRTRHDFSLSRQRDV